MGAMFEACFPFGPCTISNWTFCPSFNERKPADWIAEKCAKTSSPPSSGVIKPKPFASLNHLTVPVDILHFLKQNQKSPAEAKKTLIISMNIY